MSPDPLPQKSQPPGNWKHIKVWERTRALFYSLPNHFRTDLVVRGINVTEVFSIGGAFSTVVDTQVVSILNRLRGIWDPDDRYTDYAFVRQSQTFPDVLLRNELDHEDIVFGIELKSWYILSKEGEPSFRYQINPEACAVADLLVVTPWILSDVISGTPILLRPYVDLAKYAAQYRNYHWKISREQSGGNPSIVPPPARNRHPYPDSKQEASDKAEDDKGGNFGRIARSGILDEYVDTLKAQGYLGVRILHWISFFKAMTETGTHDQIEKRLLALRAQAKQGHPTEGSAESVLAILDNLEDLLSRLS